MDLQTRNFGTISVEADAIYSFPVGLYGFEDCNEFAIFQQDIDDELSLLYMQNTKDLFPCFLVFEPWDLFEDFDPKMSKEDLKLCEANTEDDLIFLSIARLPAAIDNLSINLKSPVVLNPKTRKARQVFLENPDYEARYFPFLSGRKDAK